LVFSDLEIRVLFFFGAEKEQLALWNWDKKFVRWNNFSQFPTSLDKLLLK
jgi:hypothetical protein